MLTPSHPRTADPNGDARRNETALRQLAVFLSLLLGGWLGWRYGFASTRPNTWLVGVPTLVGLQMATVGAVVGAFLGGLGFRLMKALWRRLRQQQ